MPFCLADSVPCSPHSLLPQLQGLLFASSWTWALAWRNFSQPSENVNHKALLGSRCKLLLTPLVTKIVLHGTWQLLVGNSPQSCAKENDCLGLENCLSVQATLPGPAHDRRGSPVRDSLQWGGGESLDSHPELMHSLAQGWDWAIGSTTVTIPCPW